MKDLERQFGNDIKCQILFQFLSLLMQTIISTYLIQAQRIPAQKRNVAFNSQLRLTYFMSSL